MTYKKFVDAGEAPSTREWATCPWWKARFLDPKKGADALSMTEMGMRHSSALSDGSLVTWALGSVTSPLE